MLDITFLCRVEYVHELPETELSRLQALAVEQCLAPGRALFLEGDAWRGVYLIFQDRVRIYKASPEGREQVLTVARPGDSFAEVPVFDGGPNPASAAVVAGWEYVEKETMTESAGRGRPAPAAAATAPPAAPEEGTES
jgi:CRP/FNR family transcriptional regulator